MTRRLSGLAAALAVLGLLLAGCNDSEGSPAPSTAPPPPEPAITVTEEATRPAPGPTPWPEPTRPAAMERDDIEGAKAAAQYFLELYAYIFATGDLAEWQSMSNPDCRFCRGAADRVQELFDAGGYATGGSFQVEDVAAELSSDGNDSFVVALTGVESSSTEYSRDGVELRALQGGNARYTFALTRDSDGWVVLGGSVEAVEGQ